MVPDRTPITHCHEESVSVGDFQLRDFDIPEVLSFHEFPSEEVRMGS